MEYFQRFLAVTVFVLGLIISQEAPAQLVQQGIKLIGTGAVGKAEQGISVALSADGNTALVGGLFDSSGAGATWVYTRSGGTWSQQGSKLVSTQALGNAQQGISVSLASDGNTALVGGPGDNMSVGAVGAAFVFTRSGALWSAKVKLIGTGAVGYNPCQGNAVAISPDGNTAILGAPLDSSGAGAAWVFTRNGDAWTQQAKLVGTGAFNVAWQGIAVALSSNGNTALVGGPYDSSYTGSTWVFTRSGSTWTQQARLVGSGFVPGCQQGTSVALSADGNTAMVGAPFDNNGVGSVWVFTRQAGVWSQQGNKLTVTDAPGYFVRLGYSVSLSADGNVAAVGAYADSSSTGAVYVFTRSGGVWTRQGTKLVGKGGVGSSTQGWSVALSSDGKTVLVGAPQDNTQAGAAWVFSEGEAAVEGSSVVVPQQFALEQNYPNPFNPLTVVGYQLPVASVVRLVVYDMLGHEVSVLVNEKKEPGRYEVTFNGSGLSSGLYFYRLQAGTFTETKKLLLVQ